MVSWVEKLSEEATRTAIGRQFEMVTEDAFNVLRWSVVVGFTRFLSLNTQSAWFDLAHWVTSALLFGYLASRFLLRPEVPIFVNPNRTWKRRLQTAANLVICMAAFMLVMLGLNHLVDGIAHYRF